MHVVTKASFLGQVYIVPASSNHLLGAPENFNTNTLLPGLPNLFPSHAWACVDASVDPASSLVNTLPPRNYIRSAHSPIECIPNQNQAHTRLLTQSHSHPLLHSHTCHHTELQGQACVCMFPDTPCAFPRTSTCPEQLSDRLVIRWSPVPRN